MRYIRVVTAMILSSFFMCFGQVKSDLRDASSATSPVRVSGAVSVVDDVSNSIRSYQVEGEFHNLSNKDIALIVVHFASDQASGPSLNFTYKEDYFFGSFLEKKGSDSFHSGSVNLKIVASEPLEDQRVAGSSASAASAEMVYVQFADGTTWGDSQSAQDVLIQRKQTAQELRRLERVLADAGEQALVNELSSESDHFLPCVHSLLEGCKGDPPSCVSEGLLSVQETARRREINMRSARQGGRSD